MDSRQTKVSRFHLKLFGPLETLHESLDLEMELQKGSRAEDPATDYSSYSTLTTCFMEDTEMVDDNEGTNLVAMS